MIADTLKLPPQTFRIGAVSRLTGVKTDLIRMWERRYAVVNPVRTEGGSRLYTQEDIARLALVKQLVDAGDAIGTVATLDIADLEKRVDTIGKRCKPKAIRGENIRVACFGHAITARIYRHRRELSNLELVGIFHDVAHARDQLDTLKVDVVIIETPYINNNTQTEVEQLITSTKATGVVVLYGFGSQRYIRRLRLLPVVTLRAPTDISGLKHACSIAAANGSLLNSNHSPKKSTTSSKIQPRRYSDEKLARIATLSTTVECECPHHLADLVFSLVSFEQYSAHCNNKNEHDAALHRYLHATTAQARSLLEVALARLIEVEGLEI